MQGTAIVWRTIPALIVKLAPSLALAAARLRLDEGLPGLQNAQGEGLGTISRPPTPQARAWGKHIESRSPHHQPSVDPLNNGLRNAQRHVPAVTATGMLPSDLQHSWLIPEDAGYGIWADLPRRREFSHGIVAFGGACRRRHFGYLQVLMANP